ncbi:MAG: hypothetical protein JWL83_502 [Actinomycetia bacterium]|nr:hypothetical protein [Actinomycetes bacterium]
MRADDPFTAFVAHARLHGVEACVYVSLREHNALGADAQMQLRDAYLGALHVHMQARRALAELHDAFDDDGIPWLVIKGAALAHVAYSRTDLRSYTDVDVVVAPAAFPDAVRALERAGHTILDQNWRAIRNEMNGQVHARLATGVTIDLHWNLINHAYLRQTFPIDTMPLLERSRVVTVGDTPIRTLSAADTLVHLALHTCLSGGDRLIWLKDVEQVLLHDQPAWPEAIDRAREWNAVVALATVLETTRSTLGVAVPRDARRALASSWWRALVRATDRANPVEAATGAASPAQMLRRAIRGTERATVVNGARHLYRSMRGSARLVPSMAGNAPDAPESVLYPSGDAGDRDAYLRAVAATR